MARVVTHPVWQWNNWNIEFSPKRRKSKSLLDSHIYIYIYMKVWVKHSPCCPPISAGRAILVATPRSCELALRSCALPILCWWVPPSLQDFDNSDIAWPLTELVYALVFGLCDCLPAPLRHLPALSVPGLRMLFRTLLCIGALHTGGYDGSREATPGTETKSPCSTPLVLAPLGAPTFDCWTVLGRHHSRDPVFLARIRAAMATTGATGWLCGSCRKMKNLQAWFCDTCGQSWEALRTRATSQTFPYQTHVCRWSFSWLRSTLERYWLVQSPWTRTWTKLEEEAGTNAPYAR